MIKVRDKLRSRRGFSMSELMVCLLILMLATGVGTQVISSGIEHYQENSRNSQAITLANTISVAVRDQLAFSTVVQSSESSRKIEDPEFISNANTLENVPCKIVTYDDKGNIYDTPTWGYVALKYTVEQANNQPSSFIYFPVSETEYDKGISALRAKVDYTYDKDSDMYEVTVSVKDVDNRIAEHEKRFSVSPISNQVEEKSSITTLRGSGNT